MLGLLFFLHHVALVRDVLGVAVAAERAGAEDEAAGAHFRDHGELLLDLGPVGVVGEHHVDHVVRHVAAGLVHLLVEWGLVDEE